MEPIEEREMSERKAPENGLSLGEWMEQYEKEAFDAFSPDEDAIDYRDPMAVQDAIMDFIEPIEAGNQPPPFLIGHLIKVLIYQQELICDLYMIADKASEVVRSAEFQYDRPEDEESGIEVEARVDYQDLLKLMGAVMYHQSQHAKADE